MEPIPITEKNLNNVTLVKTNLQTIQKAAKLNTFILIRKGKFITFFSEFRECFYALFLMSSIQTGVDHKASQKLSESISDWFEKSSERQRISISVAKEGLSLFKDWEAMLAKSTILKV